MIKWVEFHLRKEERVGGDSIDYLSWAKEKKPDSGGNMEIMRRGCLDRSTHP
jgi:hypothetical protein